MEWSWERIPAEFLVTNVRLCREGTLGRRRGFLHVKKGRIEALGVGTPAHEGLPALDGGGLPEFPTPRPDNGIARTLNVDQVPATFIAQPFAGTITPLGFGVLSTSQLSERLTVVMSPQTRGMLPNLTQRLPQ